MVVVVSLLVVVRWKCGVGCFFSLLCNSYRRMVVKLMKMIMLMLMMMMLMMMMLMMMMMMMMMKRRMLMTRSTHQDPFVRGVVVKEVYWDVVLQIGSEEIK